MRVLTLTGALLLLTPQPSGCAGPPQPSGVGFNCETHFDFGSQARPGNGRIVGAAFTICVTPPQRHVLTVSLERRDTNAKWLIRAKETSSTIPGVNFKVRKQVTVGTACSPGHWRVRARTVGRYKGKPYTAENASIERTVSRRDCERRLP
ncbi:hypothetical protein [Rhizohabitans arisaemae]|uniref:hypothetical protein n=1 Tax=Rhizohabitans arisaemae TaxID=2720610 RepID=UPI0024B21318|nr:hypothetical protein [Rhizohabitans arisaemae]